MCIVRMSCILSMLLLFSRCMKRQNWPMQTLSFGLFQMATSPWLERGVWPCLGDRNNGKPECVRKKDRDRETQGERDRDRDRESSRVKERDRDRETQREREKEKYREREGVGEREREGEKEREGERERETTCEPV